MIRRSILAIALIVSVMGYAAVNVWAVSSDYRPKCDDGGDRCNPPSIPTIAHGVPEKLFLRWVDS